MSNECPQDKNCQNQKCVDPCPGTCGIGARCQTLNHNPICSCPPKTTGDPFIRCIEEPGEPILDETEPCNPSPCGPHSTCLVAHNGQTPVCSCIQGMIGTPPNCRPECTDNSGCPYSMSCVNRKCTNPCLSACGNNAECRAYDHRATCSCAPGFTGDPFLGCSPSMFNTKNNHNNNTMKVKLILTQKQNIKF